MKVTLNTLVKCDAPSARDGSEKPEAGWICVSDGLVTDSPTLIHPDASRVNEGGRQSFL
jgi:hypothetical protein